MRSYEKARAKTMNYLSVAETAKKWGVSERSVRGYCANGKIHGAVLKGKTWYLPENGGSCFRLGQLITDVLKGNALGERAAVNAAHTVRVDGLIRDGGLCRAGLAVTLVLADNGINFFFLGAGELFGLFGFAGYRFSGQWPLPPVPFGIAAQGRRKHCWSDRAFPWDG